jgi:hypothetical protein
MCEKAEKESTGVCINVFHEEIQMHYTHTTGMPAQAGIYLLKSESLS